MRYVLNIKINPLKLFFILIQSCTMIYCQEKMIFETPARSLNYFVIGDWGRNGFFHQKDLAEVMDSIAGIIYPSFIISTGDNFYENGVASIDDPLWMSSFENIYNGAFLMREWFPVLGNHDYRGNVQAQIDYSKKSRKWVMPDRYFNFTRKISMNDSALFIFTDTNLFFPSTWTYRSDFNNTEGQDTLKQLAWLENTLANSSAKYKIVIGHHHIYTGGLRKNDYSDLKDNFEPLFDKYNVDIYFCGHEHDIQHILPQRKKTNYLVSGCGSAIRNTEYLDISKFAASVQAFMVVSMTSEFILVQVIDYQGKVIYKTKI